MQHELLHIEQYVDMVLMYLRLDETRPAICVIRACDLDGMHPPEPCGKFAGEFIRPVSSPCTMSRCICRW